MSDENDVGRAKAVYLITSCSEEHEERSYRISKYYAGRMPDGLCRTCAGERLLQLLGGSQTLHEARCHYWNKVEGCQHRSLTLNAGPAAGHFDLVQLKASLDSRRGPASYSQLQAVMAMKGLVFDHSRNPKPSESD